MRVLFVSSGNAIEGLSPLIYNQGKSLSKKDVNITFFAIKGKGFKSYIKHIFILHKFLKKNYFDVIHAHYSLSAFVASFAGCKPLIVSLMGSDVKARWYYRYAIKLFYKLSWDAVIVKSEEMKRATGIENISVIPNGVDLSTFFPISRNEALQITNWDPLKRHILFAANPNVYEKNYKLSKHALSLLKQNDIDYHVLENVPNEQMNFYLNSADIVLLTSLWEGSPNVIKESMACNRPIVSTNVGDVSWVFGSTEGCFICSFDPINVMGKIRLALDFNKSKGQTNGRDRIIELGLDSDNIAKKIISFYNLNIK